MSTLSASAAVRPAFRGRERSRPAQRLVEGGIKASLIGCATFSILTTTAILVVPLLASRLRRAQGEQKGFGLVSRLRDLTLLVPLRDDPQVSESCLSSRISAGPRSETPLG